MAVSSLANDISFAAWAHAYASLHLDLGTGDGTFVTRTARAHPALGVVGVDTCLDHLRGARRNRPGNAHFVQADARCLPLEFAGRFDRVTVHFPYGALLRAVLDGDRDLAAAIGTAAAGRATIAIVVNDSALRRVGLDVAPGIERIAAFARQIPGGRVRTKRLDADALRSFPSAWARRLGYGRTPVATRVTITR